jgi:hypothetical protein
MTGATLETTEVRDVTGGGSANGGEQTFFKFEYRNLSQQTFSCATVLMPKVINSLRAYAQTADTERVRLKGGQPGPAAPYFVTTLSNSAHSDDGKFVVVQFATMDGIPMDLAMSPQLARETIAALQREIAKVG